jgi:hypothetical protein
LSFVLEAMQRATTSLTAPGTLPAGADAVMAGAAPFFLDLSGTEICGITRSSGLCVSGCMAFSAAVMAGFRVGSTFEAALRGSGDEAGGETGDEGGWAD